MKSLFFTLVSFSIVISCQAKILYVDDNSSGGDGSSWENAYQFLQDALTETTADPNVNEIRVAQGIYTPDANSINPDGSGDRAVSFQLVNGTILQGGYAGQGAGCL